MQADRIYCGDALTVLKTLPDNSVNCCITSPPYYALRDYGVDGQIGREETPALYVERLTSISGRSGAFSRRTAHSGSTSRTPMPERAIREKALTPSTPTAGPVRWSPSTARWRAARQRT